MAAVMMHPTFNYFVNDATAANQIAATVKFTIKRWALIVAIQNQTKLMQLHHLHPHSVQVQLKREAGAEIEQQIKTGVVICTNYLLENE